ncbi:MAG: hypothetical protein JO117_03480, partial [Verrucomicrobia bacterium]|nr:hypothetical protein [Verrucomicrobiota bacterium]
MIIALALLSAALAPHPAHAWTYKLVHDFCSDSCYDGKLPAGGLIADPAGNLYGATLLGGVEEAGTIFELTYDSEKGVWGEKVLYNFCAECDEGGGPRGRLVLDMAGNLYGTTPGGGTRGDGTVFRLSPNGSGKRWSLTRLYDFCTHDSSCPDGKNPDGALTYAGQDSGELYDGVSPLFGTTGFGGKGHAGTVFSLTPIAHKWSFDLLYTFCRDSGC